jgi:hypothetical protein
MSEQKCRLIVRERSGGICELCPHLAVQCHHRRNRSQGGQWCPSNILHICVADHIWIGANIAAAVRNGWSIQGRMLAPYEVPVLLKGELVCLRDDGSVVPAPPTRLAAI